MSSLHNQIKYGTGILRAFSRLVGLGEDEEGTVRLGETLQPVIDAWALPEAAFLRGEQLCAWHRTAAAGGAATFAGVALCNPATSRRLIVVEACAGRQSAASQSVFLRMLTDADAQTPYGSSSNGALRDRRGGGPITSRAVIRYGTPAAVPTSQAIEEIFSNTEIRYIQFKTLPIVLPPGQALLIDNTTANVDLRTWWKWRERQLLPGELGT